MAIADLTAQRLRELVKYDPETGFFVRLSTGKRVGTRVKQALKFSVDGREYLSHRLAWLYMTGEWPTQEIDHMNCQWDDNRWANLRHASHNLNQQNRRRANKNSKSGLLGVSWSTEKRKWVARLYHGGKYASLGYFTNKELAHQAYLSAKRKYHVGCTL